MKESQSRLQKHGSLSPADLLLYARCMSFMHVCMWCRRTWSLNVFKCLHHRLGPQLELFVELGEGGGFGFVVVSSSPSPHFHLLL